jgi:hypothetical protein
VKVVYYEIISQLRLPAMVSDTIYMVNVTLVSSNHVLSSSVLNNVNLKSETAQNGIFRNMYLAGLAKISNL